MRLIEASATLAEFTAYELCDAISNASPQQLPPQVQILLPQLRSLLLALLASAAAALQLFGADALQTAERALQAVTKGTETWLDASDKMSVSAAAPARTPQDNSPSQPQVAQPAGPNPSHDPIHYLWGLTVHVLQ